jgi:hypothetical protein
VIDERMADLHWPGEDPLGQRIWFGRTDGPRHTIVGIVGNAKFDRIDRSHPTFYHPYEQLVDWAGFMTRTTVSQRTGEIGIRIALGAGGRTVVAMVVRQGLILALTGVALGLGAAFVVTRLMSGFLFELSTTDPWTFGVVSGLVVAIALLASYLPAWRASKVDPLVALRVE